LLLLLLHCVWLLSLLLLLLLLLLFFIADEVAGVVAGNAHAPSKAAAKIVDVCAAVKCEV
jgi:hypothetical protein